MQLIFNLVFTQVRIASPIAMYKNLHHRCIAFFFVCFPVVASSEATFDGLAYHLIVSVFMFFCSFKALVDTCCKFVGDEKLSWQDLGRKAASQVTSKLDYE